jgi:hypothetical protein
MGFETTAETAREKKKYPSENFLSGAGPDKVLKTTDGTRKRESIDNQYLKSVNSA